MIANRTPLGLEQVAYPASADSDLAKVIDEITDEGPFVAVEVAQKVIANHAELVDTWWARNHLAILTVHIRDIQRSRRARVAQLSKVEAFSKAAGEFEATGDVTGLTVFRTTFNIDGVYKPVAAMTGEDHRAVADSYKASGRYDLLMESFHRAVARKVGKKRTDEVYTEDEYLRQLGRFQKRHHEGES